jgi:hypothetical protein
MTTVVRISCPVTWYKQCDRIYANCTNPQDKTCCAAWQSGSDDIYFELDDQDAVLFVLTWT